MSVAVAVFLGVASLGLVRSEGEQNQSQPELPLASRVCIDNRAGFVLSFELWDTATNLLSRRSTSYAAPGQSCLDMWTILDIEEGHPIVTVMYVEGGISQSLPPVIYGPASGGELVAASFSCSGTTFLPTCALGGVAQIAQPGALVAPPSSPQSLQVRASVICVVNFGGFRMRFRLWDTATGIIGAWSEAFDYSSNVCVNADTLEGTSGDNPLVLITSPQGGTDMSFRSVVYDAEASAATFNCHGTTVDYNCQLLGSARRLQILI
jgi:hypothetical protein